MRIEALLGAGTCEVTLVGTCALTESGLVGGWWWLRREDLALYRSTEGDVCLATLLNLS